MTFLSLSHYFQAFLLPPGLNIFLIILGLIFWWFSPLIGKIFFNIGVISLWLLSMPYVAYNLVGCLQNQYPMLAPASLGQTASHDAIVVLGGGDSIQPEYANKHTVSDATLHRLNYAVYLQQKTHLPIIVSGGKSSGARESEADLMADFLKDNYKITAAFKEDKSMTTADESKFLQVLLKQNQMHNIYLVTNAWHMPRSVFIFQCAGIKLTPAPMGYFVYGPGYALISFLPNIDALQASAIALHEYAGLFWYRWKYGGMCRA